MTQVTQKETLSDDTRGVDLNVRPIPESLHRQLKSQAGAAGQTLKEFVIEKLQEAVSNDSTDSEK